MPYGLQSDEDSQLASIWKGSNYSRRKTRASSKASPRPSPGPAQPQEAPTHSPPLPQYRQEPSVSLPDKFNGNRLNCAPFSTSWSWCFYQPQPIQLGGNQGGHSRDPLNRRGCVVVQSHPREPPRQPRHPQLLAGFQGPADQDIFSNGHTGGFALLAIKVDARIQEHHLETQITWTRDHTQRQRTIPPHPQQNRYQQTPSQRLPPVSAPTNPMMMDLDATRRGPITPQERDRRFQGKLCFRCGKRDTFGPSAH
ncbi:hypothetical protein BASA83_011379 [Batrachochytrium salamandrivorans]|nr:hypothetical protein BASA83_011379 [Batrachochytrium salamandrivorans]